MKTSLNTFVAAVILGLFVTNVTAALIYRGTQPLQEKLFDLESDSLEEHNLAKAPAHAATLTKLRARCDALRKELR